jgi:hypothetical protein
MSSIFDQVRQQLDPDSIQQMSNAIGADPSSTQKAISMALPALLGGLSQNAAQPQGAAALDNALNAHDGSILGNLGGLLGGGGGGGGMGGIGGKILGHILGSNRAPVEQGVGKASGLDAAQVAQLMAMLAPIIMGVLGKMKREKGVDANALPDVLNRTRADAEQEAPDLGDILGGALGGLFGGRR